jgi:hypothetical protein
VILVLKKQLKNNPAKGVFCKYFCGFKQPFGHGDLLYGIMAFHSLAPDIFLYGYIKRLL